MKYNYCAVKCDCGRESLKRSSNLRKTTKGCRCEKGHNKIDETGKQYGNFKVLKESNNKHPKHKLWICQCICGKILDISGNKLRKNKIISCGCLKHQKLRKSDAGLNKIFDAYKRDAKNRNYPFELTKEEVRILIKKECYYCNTVNSNNLKLTYTNFLYNGIDRINNNIGYNLSNCVTCCKICNQMKMNRTKEEFLNQIKKIYEKTKINC